jgi:hypothetical protein
VNKPEDANYFGICKPILREARQCPQGQPQRVEGSEASGFNCVLRLVCDTVALQFICRCSLAEPKL